MRRKKRMERKCSIRYRKKKQKKQYVKWHNSRRAKGYSLFSAAPQKSPKKWEKKLVKIRVNFARTLNSITVIIQLIFKAYQWVAYYLIIINVKN